MHKYILLLDFCDSFDINPILLCQYNVRKTWSVTEETSKEKDT